MNHKFQYFKSSDIMDYKFIKAPSALFHNSKYAAVSPISKYLYIAMLERQSLSLQNGWADDSGNVYIILTHENAKKILSCSDSKTSKTFAELEAAQLIKRKRRGQGKPDIIYINFSILTDDFQENESVDKVDISVENTQNESCEFQNEELLTFKNDNSKVSENESAELLKMKPNNIKNNKNKINNINNHIIPLNPQKWIEERCEQKEIIKLNIDYDVLIKAYPKDIIDEIVSSITNAVCSTKEFISVGGEEIPLEEIKQRLLTLNQFHIEYVCDSLKRNTTSVKNMNAYLLTCLYRAADNMSIHYQLMANHDLSQEKKSKTHNGFYS